jgi:hypothetical protein
MLLQSTIAEAEHFCSNPEYGKPFKASITVQNMLPGTFLQAYLGKMANRALL